MGDPELPEDRVAPGDRGVELLELVLAHPGGHAPRAGQVRPPDPTRRAGRGVRGARYCLIRVIFEPCRPTPAISPCSPKTKA